MKLEASKEAQASQSLPWPTTCGALGLPYSSVMRWRGREARSETLVMRPGPKKVAPFELDLLYQRICAMTHCQKRTAGTGELIQEYEDGVSRRDLQEMVEMVREDIKRTAREAVRRVDWLTVGVVWSMDATEVERDENGRRRYIQQFQDLASRYKFEPLFGDVLGEEIAEHLRVLFELYGPPLFLKRDNGGNQKHHAVNEVLDEYKVIPLDSPPYYPPYNGGIEKGNSELRIALAKRMEGLESDPGEHYPVYAAQAVYDVNHIDRGPLAGQNACQAWNQGKGGVRHNKRQRRAVFDWITRRVASIIGHMEENETMTVESAWRIAAEAWLKTRGHITVTSGGQVSPCSGAFSSHN